MFCRLILLLSLALPLLSKAVTIKTISYGDWEDNLVWSGGQVPGAVDTILIRHYITLNQNLTVAAPTVIFIEASGTICGDFLLETLCGASLINYGHLYLNQIKTRAGFNYREIECKNSILVMGCPPSGSGYFNSVPPNGTVKVWPPVYCKTNDTNWESGIIGLNELQNKNVLMYPNPVTSGLLQIRTGTNTEANIFSVSGDRILTQQFEQETEIYLEFLSSGVYTLELMTDQNVWRKKFIKLP